MFLLGLKTRGFSTTFIMKYQHFQDFDAYASTVGDVDSTMMIQNPKYLNWSISHVDLSWIHIQLGREGSGNISEGQSRLDGYIIFMPLNHTSAHAVNGRALDKNSLGILEPGCDFCICCKTEHDWYSIFIPTHKLSLGSDLVEPSSGSEKMTCRVTRPNPQLAAQFQELVTSIMTIAANYSEFESSPAARCIEAELIKVASLILGQRQGSKSHPEGRPRLPREEIIRRSKALLEERDGELVLLKELEAAAGVSERTLRRAFNEYFGVGPAHYLQLRRLHQVKGALRAADSEAVSVSNILFRHGVWELGCFASQYRRLFGELPSETLRAKKRCNQK